MFKAFALACAATAVQAATLMGEEDDYHYDDEYDSYPADRTPTKRSDLDTDKYMQTIWDYRTDRRARRYDDDLPRHYDYRPRLNDGEWKYFNRMYDQYDFVVDRFVPSMGSGLGWGPYQLYGNDGDYDYFNRGQWRGYGRPRTTARTFEGVGPRVLAYRRHGNPDYHYSGVTGDDYYGPSSRMDYNDAYLGDVKKGKDWGYNGRH
jgi:hypothetical protein